MRSMGTASQSCLQCLQAHSYNTVRAHVFVCVRVSVCVCVCPCVCVCVRVLKTQAQVLPLVRDPATQKAPTHHVGRGLGQPP